MSVQASTSSSLATYEAIIDEICALNWRDLNEADLTRVAWAYYYFSIQFRENLEIARKLYPDDARLQELDRGERDTDNLSPWPGIAVVGERMNHDEFMRRTIGLTSVEQATQRDLKRLGTSYLNAVHATDDMSRALSIASYEDGGLERVFRAMVTAPRWNTPALRAFEHFLKEHIRFDSDPEQGHGALCRHLTPDDRILPLWVAFKQLLVKATPALLPS